MYNFKTNSNFRLICDPNLQEKCRFTIKQAESVYQPQIDLNAMKFEEINDGSLMHIASFLNLIDTINLGKTCKRLQSFTENIFKKRTQFSFGSAKVYDLSINKKNLSTILQEMGRYIESIQFNHLDERQLDLLSKHCRNITELKLVNPHINSNMIKQNELVFKKIQTLEIRSAHLFDAQIYAMIKSSTNLKSLSLISCCNVRGKFFSVWKDSQLDHLKIAHCWGILPSSILDFQRANKLIKFSSDVHDSFISLLTLPTVCLFNYTELELAVNSSTDEKLECLKLDELKQIQKIHLKCSLPNLQLSYNLTKSYNYNNVFAAMSSIHSLNTLIVEKCIIDADTFKALGSIQNLREIILKNTELRVGNELYSSVHVHVPKLISLSMEISFMSEDIDYASICDMISELIDLKYFFHAPMTWKLLDMIQQVRLLRKQPPIEIGISKMMFNDRRKVCNYLIF